MSDKLPLNVTVSADEWAHMQRRLRYLEAAFIQAHRGARRLKEWFSVAELAALRLRGLPSTRQGILRRAQHERWLHREMYGQGGERYEFHFSSLSRAAFDDLVERIMAPPPDAPSRPAEPARLAPPTPPADSPPAPVNAAPQWALPLMRIIRRDPPASAEEAAFRLRVALPAGAIQPSLEEVRAFLAGLSPRA